MRGQWSHGTPGTAAAAHELLEKSGYVKDDAPPSALAEAAKVTRLSLSRQR